MPRVFILMLDSFGIGATKDAEHYGDLGADTLRHIAEYCLKTNRTEQRPSLSPLHLPNLTRLGLNKAAILSQGTPIPGLDNTGPITGLYGCAEELSRGKDTQSGHWELAGVPVLFNWGYFRHFPQDFLQTLCERCKLSGFLGNKPASGIGVLEEYGAEHQQSGKPIIYTSADSVCQIAAHENIIPLEQLYTICQEARLLLDAHQIGRVIARPFGGTPGAYYRTAHRRDYAIPPPQPTLLEKLTQAGREVIAIGKVADIYAWRGITRAIRAHGNQSLFATLLDTMSSAPDNSLAFTNFVDFDTLFGHRRDIAGYANALENFDSWLPELESQLKFGDIAIITADHGCDPSWPGSDHTREHVPILVFGPHIQAKSIGKRRTFADIGQSIAQYLSIAALAYGTSFL